MKKIKPPETVPAGKPEEDYEATNAVDTLLRAHEIKGNPDLMKRVKKHGHRKMKALMGLKQDIKSIQDIRDVYQEKYGPKRQDGGEE